MSEKEKKVREDLTACRHEFKEYKQDHSQKILTLTAEKSKAEEDLILVTNRIYHHFVQGQGNPPECQRFAVHDEACRVVEVAYLWHEGGFPCPCTKWLLIIFLLSHIIDVRNPLFYFKMTTERFPIIKPRQTRHRVIVKVMTSLYKALPFCPQRGSWRQPRWRQASEF